MKEKITSDSKQKVPKKYYALLILMIMLSAITLSSNIKQYSKSKSEEYKEYILEDKQADSDGIEIVNYQTAESSIMTEVPNIKEEEVVETISNSNNKALYIMPIDGEIIKEFAIDKLVYSETLGMWKTHPGIDIKAELNDKVKSASDGTVELVKQDSFYGNTIKIVDSEGYEFVYSNLDYNINLKKGDRIKQGDIIGTVGVSAEGELQDKTHLHFEVIKDGIQVNPQDLMN